MKSTFGISMFTLILTGVLALAFTAPSQAAVISSFVTEYNGNFNDPSDPSITYPQPGAFLGTFTYSLPAGAKILSARISGTFGNNDVENTTALSDYFVNNGKIQVAACDTTSLPCFSNDINLPPVAWSYTFTPAQLTTLASGTLDFTEVQNGPFSVQTGTTELDVTIAPEPASLLLFGIGLSAVLIKRRY